MQSKVCFESATAVREFSSRPARRCSHDRTGITARLSAAMMMPGVEWCASPAPASDRIESTVTNAAKAKKEIAISRSVRCSRRSGSLAENCQDNARADATSITESRPKPIKADESATLPAHKAMMASTMLYVIVAAAKKRMRRVKTARREGSERYGRSSCYARPVRGAAIRVHGQHDAEEILNRVA